MKVEAKIPNRRPTWRAKSHGRSWACSSAPWRWEPSCRCPHFSQWEMTVLSQEKWWQNFGFYMILSCFIHPVLLLLVQLLKCELQTAVDTAGPKSRVTDLSVHCRNSTASARSQSALLDTAGLQPRVTDLMGIAGLQLREPNISGHCGSSITSARCHVECQNVR